MKQSIFKAFHIQSTLPFADSICKFAYLLKLTVTPKSVTVALLWPFVDVRTVARNCSCLECTFPAEFEGGRARPPRLGACAVRKCPVCNPLSVCFSFPRIMFSTFVLFLHDFIVLKRCPRAVLKFCLAFLSLRRLSYAIQKIYLY